MKCSFCCDRIGPKKNYYTKRPPYKFGQKPPVACERCLNNKIKEINPREYEQAEQKGRI